MKFIAYLISIFLFSLIGLKVNAQQIGHTSVTFIDPSRNNRQVTSEVYYPSLTAGENTPISTGVFPLIIYGHGFLMTWSSYQSVWSNIVPQGYILVFPTTEGGFTPVHSDFGLDMKFLISEIQNNGAGTSVPASSVGNKSAIMGHSMGGGCSFLSANENSSISTIVSFAAANTNPSSVTAAQNVTIPTLIFSGTNDCVAPPSQHQDIMYDSTTANLKTQIYIKGGGHCYFADNNFNCTFGEATCTPSPIITREQQQSTTFDFLNLWLAMFLKDDCEKGQDFQDSLGLSDRITYRQNQSISCDSGIIEKSNNAYSITNPFSDKIRIDNLNGLENFQLCDLNGKCVWQGEQINEQDFSGYPNGVYFLKIILPNSVYTFKVIKQ